MKAMTAVVALALAATTAMAEPGGRGGGGSGDGPRGMGGPDGMGNRAAMAEHLLTMLENNPERAQKLGVTTEQVTALRASFDTFQQESIDLRAAEQKASLEVRKLMRGDAPDEAAVLAAVEKEAAAKLALQKATIKQRLAAQKILGKETLQKIRQAIGERMRERFGRDGDDDDDDKDRRPGSRKGGKPWMQDEMTPPPPAE